MDKGYYSAVTPCFTTNTVVAIHNKNGQGLLQATLRKEGKLINSVAIHNKNGQGLLRPCISDSVGRGESVAIHNKNGQGLLHDINTLTAKGLNCRNPQ